MKAVKDVFGLTDSINEIVVDSNDYESVQNISYINLDWFWVSFRLIYKFLFEHSHKTDIIAGLRS